MGREKVRNRIIVSKDTMAHGDCFELTATRDRPPREADSYRIFLDGEPYVLARSVHSGTFRMHRLHHHWRVELINEDVQTEWTCGHRHNSLQDAIRCLEQHEDKAKAGALVYPEGYGEAWDADGYKVI